MRNIQELFELLLAGKKVRYKTWHPTFYIYLENGILYREDKNIFSGYFTIDPEFWEEYNSESVIEPTQKLTGVSN
jgi:hypothetical protein